MGESQTVLEPNEVILVGLPGPGLTRLYGQPGFRLWEDSELQRACAHPLETGVFDLSRIPAKLASACCTNDPGAPLVLIYVDPAGFVERGIANAAETLRTQHVDVESFTRNLLDFWRACHLAVLEQYQQNSERAMLLNGDRPPEAEQLSRRLRATFGERLPPDREAAAITAEEETDTAARLCYQRVVDELAPECTELYLELEDRSGADEQTDRAEGLAVKDGRKTVSALLQILIERTLIRHELEKGESESHDLAVRIHSLKDRGRQQEAAIRQSEATRKDLLSENGLLYRQLLGVQDSLKEYYGLNRKLEKEVRTLREELGRRRLPLKDSIVSAMRRLRNTILSAVEFPFRVIDHIIPIPGKERRQYRRQMKLLERSGLFDTRWYLETYPDVAATGSTAVEHYLEYGADEGRNPGPDFDTRWYLEMYPDVADAGMNPLLHYILHGKDEGRRPKWP